MKIVLLVLTWFVVLWFAWVLVSIESGPPKPWDDYYSLDFEGMGEEVEA